MPYKDPQKAREVSLRWYRNHREVHAKYKREHPEVCKRYNDKYRAKHLGEKAEYMRRRHALKTARMIGDKTALRAFYAWARNTEIIPCWYCWTPTIAGHRNRHVDHMQPLKPSDGVNPGAHDIRNLCVACRTCNQRKRNKPLILWLSLLTA